MPFPLNSLTLLYDTISKLYYLFIRSPMSHLKISSLVIDLKFYTSIFFRLSPTLKSRIFGELKFNLIIESDVSTYYNLFKKLADSESKK